MIWLMASDSIYFDRDKDILKKKIENALTRDHSVCDKSKIDLVLDEMDEKIYFNPSKRKVRKIIGKRGVVISSFPPSHYGYDDYGVFSTIEIKGDNFPFTVEQEAIGVSKSLVMENIVGMQIMQTDKTLKDLVGVERLHEYLRHKILMEKLGISRFRGMFFFGVAGSGKSYTAECLAGELDRYLVVLDLPYIMSLPSPTRRLDMMFDMLLRQKNNKYLLFIDEIEKMFDFGGVNLAATQVFGKLLTRLNDLYNDPKSNIMFFVTANNITKIIEQNPEFLRKGRFDKLLFINYPTLDNAEKILDFYKERARVNLQRVFCESIGDSSKAFYRMAQTFSGEGGDVSRCEYLGEHLFISLRSSIIMRHIEEKFRGEKINPAQRYFIYTPPEINAFVETIVENYFVAAVDFFEANDRFGKIGDIIPNVEKFLDEVASEIVPLQVSAREGIARQMAQAMDFSKSGSTPFQEIN